MSGSIDNKNSPIEESYEFLPVFDDKGLIPAIAVDNDGGEVLMFAWMNEESLNLSLQTGYAHYYSRSRKKIWKKGETSGNTQKIQEIRVDCDQDVLMLKVIQEGDSLACHTNRYSCFYRKLDLQNRSLSFTESTS